MDKALAEITVQPLILAFLAAVITVGIIFRWTADAQRAAYATLRMLIQLLLIGYALVYIFETNQPRIIIAVLVIMLAMSSLIAIRPCQNNQPDLYLNALGAISVGGVLTLALVTKAALSVQPWFCLRQVVPLAGMNFAGAMNAVSLAAERRQAESNIGIPYRKARRTALQAS